MLGRKSKQSVTKSSKIKLNIISALSSGNVSKYEFLTDKDVLPETELSEKATALKRFECLPLGRGLKKQTSVAEKKYQGLNKFFKV